MRSGNYSATIVVNGIEQAGQADGVVPVGFRDEYTIRLRSHNDRRAVARIWVDEVEVTGGGLVVPAYGYVDLETPPASPGSRFRFVPSGSGEAHRAGKGGPDDGTKGLVRVEFVAEKERARPVHVLHSQPHWPQDFCSFAPAGVSLISGGGRSASAVPQARDLEAGVTVAGSASHQTFHTVEIETEGAPVVIMLKLKGFTPPAPTSSHRLFNYCSHCGLPANVLSNICECGYNLR